MKIGKILKEIPKASGGDRKSENFKNVPYDKFENTKAEVVRDLGFTPKQTAQFQQMADHEEIVHEAIAEAREKDDIISRSAVLKKIAENKNLMFLSTLEEVQRQLRIRNKAFTQMGKSNSK